MKKFNLKINGVSKFIESEEDLFLINILEAYIKKNKNIAVALNYKIVSKKKMGINKT